MGMRGWAGLLALILTAGCGVSAASPGATKKTPRYNVARAEGPGSFFLSGGGEDTPALMQRFVGLAGGKNAALVVVPFAGGTPQGGRYKQAFAAAGATRVTVLTGLPEDRTSELQAIKDADGVFFAGGLPDKLLRDFEPFMETARAAWRDGCVMGGHSAGSMVWGSRLILDGELTDATAHGLDAEAGGLELVAGWSFLPDTIIDPHFTERSRFFRLWLATGNAGALGVGIDPETAAVWGPLGTLAVHGTGTVTVMRPEGAAMSPARVTVLKAGQQLELRDWSISDAR